MATRHQFIHLVSCPLIRVAESWVRILTGYASTANITGLGDWAEALKKAQALVAQMTLEEKV